MIRNVAATLALAGLVLSQPAAAERSGESLPAPGAKVSLPQARVGSKVNKSEDIVGTTGFIIAAIVGVSVVSLIVAATKGKHEGDNNPDVQSPG